MDYDPFARGPFPVGVRTGQAIDSTRHQRRFPFELWYPAAAPYAGHDGTASTQDTFTVLAGFPPLRQAAVRDAEAQPGTYPLIVFSHSSGGHRRQSTFLCTHLASHGYIVVAVDHTGNTLQDAAALARRIAAGDDTPAQRATRVQEWIAARVPDLRCLLDHLLSGAAGEGRPLSWAPSADAVAGDVVTRIDPHRIGMAGHSFGGWAALAIPAVDRRIGAVLVLAPGGSTQPRPGIIPATLTFAWGRDVPTLLLVAERDTLTPLAGMYELFARAPATKHMVILRAADHFHFCDHVEQVHERVRTRPRTGDTAWMAEAMPPIGELCPGEHAYLCVRGLGLAHMDAVLKGHEGARRLLASDLKTLLAERGVNVIVHQP
jgi:dienelactone hydrolase